MKAHPFYELMGVSVNSLTMDELNGLVAECISSRTQVVIGAHNMHSVYLHNADARFRAFYAEVDHTHIDGMPLILAARMKGFPFDRSHRVTYVEWVWPLLARAEKEGWRVFYLGSTAEVLSTALKLVRDKHPDLVITGRNGYFNANTGSQDSDSTVMAINQFRPDILLVGMGMPRQEYWIGDNRRSLTATVILPSGACMDYVAGAIRTPPRMGSRLGLEWLFRLLDEPGRLWQRYLVEPLLLARILASRWARNKISYSDGRVPRVGRCRSGR